MVDQLPKPVIATRSAEEIHDEILRVTATLRALRAEQAEAHFTARAAIAAKIKLVQERLDRLYEEKRMAQAPPRIAPRQSCATSTAAREPAAVVARIFADT